MIPVVTDGFGTDYSFKVTRPSATLTTDINEDMGTALYSLIAPARGRPSFAPFISVAPGLMWSGTSAGTTLRSAHLDLSLRAMIPCSHFIVACVSG